MCPELLQSAGILGFGFSEIQASRIDPGRIDRIVRGLNNRMDNGSVLNRTTSVPKCLLGYVLDKGLVLLSGILFLSHKRRV